MPDDASGLTGGSSPEEPDDAAGAWTDADLDADLDVADPRLEAPLDASDPRFLGSRGVDVPRERRLERSRGPGAVPDNPRVHVLRLAIPALVVAGLLVTAAVFWRGLDPPSGRLVVGPEDAVRAAISDRPHRVCLNDLLPCAWLTVVDGRLLALNTAGPLREEYGKAGVTWCPSSGYYGSNSLGSRFDQAGTLVRGPAPRGMDRFDVRVGDDGMVVVNFLDLTTGRQARHVEEVHPPDGPDCAEIPFDREADLRLQQTSR
jgi:hypothetical protein